MNHFTEEIPTVHLLAKNLKKRLSLFKEIIPTL